MSKAIWRVEWDIHQGPHTQTEFTNEKKGMEWAEGLFKAGGKGIVVTELIVGRIIKLNTESPLFQK